MTWTSIHLKVTTPLFNGGADGDAGFRISSLRGAMRFWFRALAGLGLGHDLTALAKLEGHVFGATDRSSPVKLRLASTPRVRPPGAMTWCTAAGDSRWIAYLLGQGLGNMRSPVSVTRPYIDVDEPVTIQARLDTHPGIATIVLASLWLTCTYGGLGARTRRGFGGLRIIGTDGPLPAPWTSSSLSTPDAQFHQGIRYLWPTGPLGQCMPLLAQLAKECGTPLTPTAAADPPRYPLFSKTSTVAGLSGGEHFNHWTYLLSHAGQQMRHFRATEPAPNAHYNPKIKTPEWLYVVNGPRSEFGLGALGLPVVFKENKTVNAYQNGEPLRRASPLWLRPVGRGDNWRLLSFAFHSEFLPTTAATQLKRGNAMIKPVTVTHADVVTRTTQWIANLNQDVDLSER